MRDEELRGARHRVAIEERSITPSRSPSSAKIMRLMNKYGLSWQLVPRMLGEMMVDG